MLAYSELTTLSLRRPVPRRELVPALVGEYELGRCLGHGGMGMVFEARHRLLDRPAAIKVIRPELRDNHEAQLRLAREGRALAQIQHPNVVSLFEMSGADGSVFIAMELLDGGTLRDWMRASHEWREILAMFVRFGGGLAATHALGLVHRDVNPANIFLARDGTPKLGDFGLVCADGEAEGGASELAADHAADHAADRAPDHARCEPAPSARGSEPGSATRGHDATYVAAARTPNPPPIELPASLFDHALTLAGSVLGTQAYMAPEQKRGDRVGAAADQYSFCASLHEALVGDVPRGGELGALPAALHRVLSRGLAPQPGARFPSLRALLAALPR